MISVHALRVILSVKPAKTMHTSDFKAVSTVDYTVRLDAAEKEVAESIFNDLGLSLATGFDAFVKTVVRRMAVPFEVEPVQFENSGGLTDEQRKAVQKILDELPKIRAMFTDEDYAKFEELESGKFKMTFEERLIK